MNQQMPSNISTIVLTYNEEMNLPFCLESLKLLNGEVIVLDSGSTDKTLKIAEHYGAKIYSHELGTWASGSEKLNWVLDTIPMQGDWFLRLDADERLTPELASELVELSSRKGTDYTGFCIKRRYYFMGRWIRHGDCYRGVLRLWRKGKAYSENKLMDQHMILLEGKTGWLKHDLMDWDQKDLTFFVEKHNRYSSEQARELFSSKGGSPKSPDTLPAYFWGLPYERKRWLKENVYVKSPTFFRCLAYFLYRYVCLLGFLDGKEGLVYHFLQAFWYRFLSDAKLLELERRCQLPAVPPVIQSDLSWKDR